MDNKIIQVALDGLENILKVGEMDKAAGSTGVNMYAVYIEEAGGMEKIHNAQNNANEEIYMKAYHIIETYFSDEDEGTGQEIEGLAPAQGQEGFSFGAQAPAEGGFNFNNASNGSGDHMDM